MNDSCLTLLDLADYLCKSIGSIDCINAACRTILNRCYYAEYNYLIEFAIENDLRYQAGIGASSHKDTINSITDQMKERFPEQRRLIGAIKKRMLTAKEQRQVADYYHGGSRRYSDVISIPPEYFAQYVKDAREVCENIDKVVLTE